MNDLVEQLYNAGEQLAALGLSPGTSGNISVRKGAQVLMSPSGSSLAHLRGIELSKMNLDAGGMKHVGGPVPSKEFGLHEAMYRRDEAAVCVIHLHSPQAVAASCLPPWAAHSALPPLTPYLLMRVGNLPMIPYHPPGDPAQARMLWENPINCNAALLQNHGPVVAGETVAEAIARCIEVEEASRTVVTVGSHPAVRVLEDSETQYLALNYGQPWGSV